MQNPANLKDEVTHGIGWQHNVTIMAA